MIIVYKTRNKICGGPMTGGRITSTTARLLSRFCRLKEERH